VTHLRHYSAVLLKVRTKLVKKHTLTAEFQNTNLKYNSFMGISLGVERPRCEAREATHSLSSRTEFKNEWS
jgi:hypothetical protein